MGEVQIPRVSQRGIAAGVVIFGLLVTPVPGKKLEITKKVGNLTVNIGIERDPPTVGKNAMEIRVWDESGKAIQEAKVLLNYYMPPMPRMAPMNYKVEAKRKNDAYLATMKLIMAGPWIIVLRITIDDKTLTTKFHIDAR